jgi:hypothetical protein
MMFGIDKLKLLPAGTAVVNAALKTAPEFLSKPATGFRRLIHSA